MSTAHAVTYERFDEENEDRFELAGHAGYAAATDQGHQVWILELWVDPDSRGQGRATALLETVIARYPGRVLALSAEPITMTDHDRPGPSADQLAAWYTRHGFNSVSGHRMTRIPGGDRASLAVDPAAPRAAATDPNGARSAAAAGPTGGPDFPKPPLATPAGSPMRRSAGTSSTPSAGLARLGRPR